MTKKDLFRLIIKLFGLYSLLNLTFYLIPQTFATLFYIYDTTSFLQSICICIIAILVPYILIAKPDWIIKTFKLDHGFDNNDAKDSIINTNSIVPFALLICSFYLICVNAPDFLTNLFFAFKNNTGTNESFGLLADNYDPFRVDYYVLTTSGISLIIGFLTLTNLKKLTVWLKKKVIK